MEHLSQLEEKEQQLGNLKARLVELENKRSTCPTMWSNEWQAYTDQIKLVQTDIAYQELEVDKLIKGFVNTGHTNT